MHTLMFRKIIAYEHNNHVSPYIDTPNYVCSLEENSVKVPGPGIGHSGEFIPSNTHFRTKLLET